MSATLGFPLFLSITVILLLAVMASGVAARRRLHLKLVISMGVGLLVTIYYAEQLGKLYDLETAGWVTPLHLFLAKVTCLGYAAPIATGIATWRGKPVQNWHRCLAWTIFSLTLATAFTGVWMILAAERLAG